MRSQSLDIDQLHEALKAARRRGVRAARLVNHARGVIELLYPQSSYPELTLHQRAFAAENLIVAAVDTLRLRDPAHVFHGAEPARSGRAALGLVSTQRRSVRIHRSDPSRHCCPSHADRRQSAPRSPRHQRRLLGRAGMRRDVKIRVYGRRRTNVDPRQLAQILILLGRHLYEQQQATEARAAHQVAAHGEKHSAHEPDVRGGG